MKYCLGVFFAAFLFFQANPAHAFRASHFKGAYEVLNARADEEKKYFVCDVDTVANIWAKYGQGDLPADLVPIKDEPSILAAFTFRKGLIFTLEKAAAVEYNYLAVPGAGTDRLELYDRGNGTYQLGVRFDGQVSVYELGPKQGIDRFSVASTPHPRLQDKPAAERAIAALHGQP